MKCFNVPVFGRERMELMKRCLLEKKQNNKNERTTGISKRARVQRAEVCAPPRLNSPSYRH